MISTHQGTDVSTQEEAELGVDTKKSTPPHGESYCLISDTSHLQLELMLLGDLTHSYTKIHDSVFVNVN